MKHNHVVVSVSVLNAGMHPSIYCYFNQSHLMFRRNLMCYSRTSNMNDCKQV